MRGAIFVVPIIAYQITKRICVALQRADRQRLLHGSPSGEIIREPNGAFHEAHVPISDDEAWTLTQQKTYPVLAAGSIDDRGRKVSKKRARWMKWFLGDNVPKVTREELDAARHHAEIGSSRSATQAEITD
jgi:ubiquinol-cytochrome c reductase cytochrome b subunit